MKKIVDGENEYSYTYDENGIRTSKTVNGVTTYYNTKDSVILSQSDGTNTMYFQYDTDGVPIGFIYNGIQYLYMTNQMGDVIAITETDGNVIAEYVYDEWGKLLTLYTVSDDNAPQAKAVNANPLCYRGYYYDNETGYYYLQSRYYDPSICRFINADIVEITSMSNNVPIELNLFVYCSNNPIDNVDYSGYYSASNAKRYAEKWWDRKKGINSQYGQISYADCTNFVSACLYAGGLSKMIGTGRYGWHCKCKNSRDAYYRRTIYYDRSHAWGAAQNLYDWLHSSKHTSYTYVIRKASDVDNVGRILYSKPICAAAIFFDKEPNYNKDHAALSGTIIRSRNCYDIYYYAHTSDRNGKAVKGCSVKDYFKTYKKGIVYVCILK